MKLKKLKAVLLILSLLLTMTFSNVIYAQDNVTGITVENTDGAAGETVSVTVGLKNLPEDTVAVQLWVNYNQDVLELTEVDSTSGILADSTCAPDLNRNPYGLGWGYGLTVINSSATGQIAVLKFKILDNVQAASTNVTISYDEIYDMDMDSPQMEENAVDAVITIKQPVHDHTFGEWEITHEATCTEEGLKTRTCTICGYEEQEVIAKAEHQLSEWRVTKEATCTEPGEKNQICTQCQQIINTAIIEPTGHTEKIEVIKEATCTETGESRTICSVCNEELAVNIIPVKDHTPGEVITVKEPSCTETGKTEQRCTVCDAIIDEKIIDAKGHSFGEWTTVKEATILEDGEEKRICSVCNEEETRIIPKLSHEEGDHVFDGRVETVKEATCTEDGIKRVYCSVDLCTAYTEISIPATGHTAGEWEIVKNATCTEPGEKVKKCIVCGEILETSIIDSLGHTYGEWQTTKEPTCTEAGERVHVCTACGNTETEIIEATGHTEGEWKVVKAATCTESGLQEKHCTVCDALLATEVIDKLPHTYGEWEITKESTCTETGEKRAECTVCGEEIIETIAQLEHTAGEWKITKEATCEEGGEKESRCLVCDTLLERVEIPALGHSYGEANVIKAATCTESGEAKKVCIRCQKEVMITIEALGHSYGAPVVTKEATFNEEGESVRTCEVCQHTLKTIIPKLSEGHEHDYSGKQEIVKEATCTETGEMYVYCAEPDCGAYKIVEIAPTGHQYGEWVVTKAATTENIGSKERVCSICQNKEVQEIAKLTKTDSGKNPAKDSTKKESDVKASPKTGDAMPLTIVLLIFVISGVVLLTMGTIFLTRKKKY